MLECCAEVCAEVTPKLLWVRTAEEIIKLRKILSAAVVAMVRVLCVVWSIGKLYKVYN